MKALRRNLSVSLLLPFMLMQQSFLLSLSAHAPLLFLFQLWDKVVKFHEPLSLMQAILLAFFSFQDVLLLVNAFFRLFPFTCVPFALQIPFSYVLLIAHALLFIEAAGFLFLIFHEVIQVLLKLSVGSSLLLLLASVFLFQFDLTLLFCVFLLLLFPLVS